MSLIRDPAGPYKTLKGFIRPFFALVSIWPSLAVFEVIMRLEALVRPLEISTTL